MKNHWSLIAAILILWVIVGFNIWSITDMCDGKFFYTIDDPYISMAVGDGALPLWASSSIAWQWIAGIHYLLPLILNVLFGTLILIVIYFSLPYNWRAPKFTKEVIGLNDKEYCRAGTFERPQIRYFIILGSVILFSTMTTSIFVGLEHILHTYVFLWILFTIPVNKRSWTVIMSILTIFLVLLRFESGLLLVLLGIYWYFIKKIDGYRVATVLTIAIIPLGIWALVLLNHGGTFLPNPVLLKLGKGISSGVLSSFDRYLTPILVPIIVYLTYWLTDWRFLKKYYMFILLVFVLFLLSPPRQLVNSFKNIARIPQASQNIYHQQYQMAQFIREYYPDATVALNDIGCVSYYTDAKVIDLVGLANMDVARAKRSGSYTKETIRAVTKDCDFAIIYPGWFAGMIPDEWVPTAMWVIQNNVSCSRASVVFFAINESYDSLLYNIKCYAGDYEEDFIYPTKDSFILQHEYVQSIRQMPESIEVYYRE